MRFLLNRAKALSLAQCVFVICTLVSGIASVALFPARALAADSSSEPSPDQRRHLIAIERSLEPSDAPGSAVASIEQRLAHWQVPAASVAVFGEGKIKWAKAWGYADAATRQTATVATLFQAGSISKPLTAAAILQLVEEHRIDLDGDIDSSLRSWKLPRNSWSNGTLVTPAMLISHTAGISVRSFPGYASSASVPSVGEILAGVPPANTAPIGVIAQPGAAYSYSGGGYVVLQQAITDITGKPFSDVMSRKILTPLGMSHSTFMLLRPGAGNDIASWHTPTGARVEGSWHLYPESAAAGLWSTPSELAYFAMAIQSALQGSHSIVSQQSAAWMI
jgi:CubicO group peptidase (beta-lactamase class C family)